MWLNQDQPCILQTCAISRLWYPLVVLDSSRAHPAHALSHEIPAKKINTIFGCRARQLDHPANSATVTCENITHSNPAKNKYRSGLVFIVVTPSKISEEWLWPSFSHMATKSDVTKKGLKKGVRRPGNIFSISNTTNIYKSCDRDHVRQYLEPNLRQTGSFWPWIRACSDAQRHNNW